MLSPFYAVRYCIVQGLNSRFEISIEIAKPWVLPALLASQYFFFKNMQSLHIFALFCTLYFQLDLFWCWLDMSIKFARYAMELLRFNEAGVEVVVMAYLRSIFIPRVLSALDCNIMSGCKGEMGKVVSCLLQFVPPTRQSWKDLMNCYFTGARWSRSIWSCLELPSIPYKYLLAL